MRASVIGIFVLGVPAALTLKPPRCQGALLEMHGVLGKPGWFWMFVLEGVAGRRPRRLRLFYLDDSPQQARFLTEEERTALVAQLAAERQQAETSSVKAALKTASLASGVDHGTLQIGVYGLMFFLPSQVASLMGTISASRPRWWPPFPGRSLRWASISCRALPTETPRRLPSPSPAWSRRRWKLVVSSYAGPLLAIAALSCCAVSFTAVQPIFWTFPAQVLHRPGTGGRHRLLHHARRGVQHSCLSAPRRNGVFTARTPGPLVLAAFALLCAALLWALKPAHRRPRGKQDAKVPDSSALF